MIKESLASNIVLWQNYREGTFLDKSGNSNDGTPTSTIWRNGPKGRVIDFSTSSGRIDVSDSNELQLTTGTIVVFGEFESQTASHRFLAKRDGGGTNYDFYEHSATQLAVYDGTTTSIATVDIVNTQMVGCVFANGNAAKFYTDGNHIADGALSNTVSVDDAPLKIGSALDNTQNNADRFYEVLIFDIALTGQQISELYNEWLQEANLNKIPEKTNLPEISAYNEFERDLEWTKGTGWTIANGKASSDGSQTDDSDLTQNIGTIGNTYTIEYSVSNYSAGNITGLAGTAEGTDRAANGVYTDGITAAGSGLLGLRADLDFVGDIDWIKIGDGVRVDYYADGKDWNTSVGNVTAGFLENTGWEISTGTWQVDDSTGADKQITNIAAGILFIRSDQAYGQWEFDIYKDNTANILDVMFMADTIGGGETAGQDGYGIRFDDDETIAIFESVNGTPTDLVTSTALSLQTWYSIKVTRTAAGLFTLYIDGTSTGTPATDTTTTASTYTAIDADAADAIRNFRYSEIIT